MVKLVNNIDLLFDKVELNGHVCVGLDTCVNYLPPNEKKNYNNDCDAVFAYNKKIIDATCDIAACYKVQIAYYEEMGIQGLSAYSKTLKYIKSINSLVIADIKRGDIADTAFRYAKAHYNGDFAADFVTLNPYMGMDSIQPWFRDAQVRGKGAFVLMRTSNPGMKDFEYLEIKSTGGKLYNEVGTKLSALTELEKGYCGYGIFGAVVGCTEIEEAAEIREKYPNLFFLIPGYGAQGGDAKTAAALLREGNGGVVNASRSIITAWKQSDKNENADFTFAAEKARYAVIKMRDEILKEVEK